MKFLIKEGIHQPAEILRTFQAQFGEQTLLKTIWGRFKYFKDNKFLTKCKSEETNPTNDDHVQVPVKAKTRLSARKMLATTFWDSAGVLLIEFLHDRRTVNTTYYYKIL